MVSNSNNTKVEPIIEEITIPILEKEFRSTVDNPKKLSPIIKIATPKPAPELIPKIYGPANGFLNKVCIFKPATDSALPHSTAAMAFGSRDSKTIISQLFFVASSVKRILMISLKGIFTDPKNKSNPNRITILIDSAKIKIKKVLFFSGVIKL